MKLKDYIRQLPQDDREKFAISCGTSLKYLRLVSYEAKPCSERLALDIEKESAGAVTVAEVLPGFAQKLIAAGYIRPYPRSVLPCEDAA